MSITYITPALSTDWVEPVAGPEPQLLNEPAGWPAQLPVLQGPRVTLRDLRIEDAAALFAELTEEEVTRFISPPPADVAGFEQFIRWAHMRRSQGRYACFAVVREGDDAPVGMIQAHLTDRTSATAEWGFVLGKAHWGCGVFLQAAVLMLGFLFDVVGVARLEARACVANGRGNGALRKLGAGRSRLLKRAFLRSGRWHDQILWTMSPERWREWITPRGGVH